MKLGTKVDFDLKDTLEQASAVSFILEGVISEAPFVNAKGVNVVVVVVDSEQEYYTIPVSKVKELK